MPPRSNIGTRDPDIAFDRLLMVVPILEIRSSHRISQYLTPDHKMVLC